MSVYTQEQVNYLVEGKLDWDTTMRMLSMPKDHDRFRMYLNALQSKLPWDDKIILPISLHLYVAQNKAGLAEIGDKTQLLSLVLAARYRKPIPIVLGAFVATLVNHSCSGALGVWLASVLSPTILTWAVVASFTVMAG